MLGRRAGDLSEQQQLAIARALIMQPKLIVLDEPTEGIQPSIIKDIGCAIACLGDQGKMAIVMVERAPADRYAMIERGEVVLAGEGSSIVESNVRRYRNVLVEVYLASACLRIELALPPCDSSRASKHDSRARTRSVMTLRSFI
jgi:ABC-type branched-subunit amino acid transport system ATPase component